MELLIRRIVSNTVDYMIVSIISMIVVIPLGILKWSISWIPFIGWLSRLVPTFFVISLFYVIYECYYLYSDKQTIGRRLVGLNVRFNVSKNNDDFFWSVVLRTLVKQISVNFFFVSLVSVLIMLLNDEHSSLHDLIAKSRVWHN